MKSGLKKKRGLSADSLGCQHMVRKASPTEVPSLNSLNVYVAGASAVRGGLYAQGSGQPLGGEFRCNGMEKHLNSCIYSESYTCGHHEDAGVICPSACEEGEVRLVNFTHSFSGRVEMCYKGDWVSLCLDDWSIEEAQVICQQIGSFKEGSQEETHTLYRYT